MLLRTVPERQNDRMNSGGDSPGDAEGDIAGERRAAGDRPGNEPTGGTDDSATGGSGAEADIPNGDSADTPGAADSTTAPPAEPGGASGTDHEDAGERPRPSRYDGTPGEEPGSSAPDTGGDGTAPAAAPPSKRRRRRWLRVLTAALVGVLLIGAAGAGWAYWRTEQSLDSIQRIPQAMPTVPEEQQPTRIEGDSLVFLLVGLDAESADTGVGDAEINAEGEPEEWKAGEARSDTMMLLQLPADRSTATVVSLPRDSWVEVPGRGSAKLNAAYSWGGPALMVETVQNLTDLRVDHLAVIDWAGFRELTDAVGGVRVDGERMDGRAALDYVRERKGLPEGDLDRTRRQQHFLRSLLNQTLSSDTLSSPSRLNGLLNTVGDVVSVDEGLSNGDIRELAWALRGLRGDEVRFMNAPVLGTDTIDGQSVVLLDEESAAPLWKAMKEDEVQRLIDSGEAPDDLGDDVA